MVGDKMAPIESSINQAIQLPLTIWLSSLIPLPLRPIQAYHLFVTCDYRIKIHFSWIGIYILSVPVCPYHFVRAILSNTILSGHHTNIHKHKNRKLRATSVTLISTSLSADLSSFVASFARNCWQRVTADVMPSWDAAADMRWTFSWLSLRVPV